MRESGKYAFFTCAKEIYKIDEYAFDTEAILISGNGANVGYVHYYNGKFNAYQRTYILHNFKCDAKFLKYQIERNIKKRIYIEKSISNTPYIVLSTITEMEILIPESLEEQKKIAFYIEQVDEVLNKNRGALEVLISSRDRIFDKILRGAWKKNRKNTEIGLLPHNWEIVTIGDIFQHLKRKNNGNISNNVLTISAQQGLINQEEYFNKVVASSNLEKYYLIKKGEFAYNKSYSAGYPVGATKILERYEEGIVSTLYICFKIKEEYKIFQNYFKYFFESKIYYKELEKIVQEGARNHGLLNINVKDFFELKILKPSLNDVIKMNSFLNLYDKKIELLENKMESYENIKKVLMKKLLTGKIKI